MRKALGLQAMRFPSRISPVKADAVMQSRGATGPKFNALGHNQKSTPSVGSRNLGVGIKTFLHGDNLGF
jgi:hypothetical protein